jgi:hypothetical protein
MKVLSRISCRVAVAILGSVQVARASDWYVDALNGSNANSGASATNAWRTISFAVANTPVSGLQTIHVAAGTYDTALGEVFPFDMRPKLQVLGNGSSSTHVVGSSTAPIFSLVSDYHAAGYTFQANTRIVGLHLVGGTVGVSMYSNWNPVSPTLRNLEIEQSSTAGIYVSASSQFAGSALPTIEFVDIHHCNVGLDADDKSIVTVRDSTIRDNTSNGVVAVGGWGTSRPSFQRCRIEHNGAHGVYAHFYNYGAVVAHFEDCSISLNTLCGWYSLPYGSGFGGACGATFDRCTIAHNGTIGAFNDPNLNIYDSVVLDQSIVWGNADDLDAAVTASNCDIGEPVAGTGNFTSDPLFENAAAGDFRLRFGSPCIDAAASAPPAGTLDLAGHARDVDGDLNTSEVADLGAFEFRPLEFVGTAQLGTVMKLELRGPQGAASALYWTRGALAAMPMGSQFGRLDLQPSLAHVYRIVTVGSITPAIVQRTIPNAAFLVGQTFAFQALTDNQLAPAGKAYTNPVEFTVVP